MLTLVSMVFAFSLLVVFHEFGHFIVAKLLKVKVEKFAIGFGKEIIGFSGEETRYSLNFFPLGGFVKMLGDEPGDEKAKDPRSYLAQPWYKRIFIVLCGPLMNFILTIILLVIIFLTGVYVPDASIGNVMADSPAAKAGLKSGDLIVKINNVPVETWNDLTKLVYPNAGKELTLLVKRSNNEMIFKVVPKFDEERKIGLLGIIPSDGQKLERYGIIEACKKGTLETYTLTIMTLQELWKMFTGKIAPDVSGPIGIIKIISISAKAGFNSLVGVIALLSINLGIINLFPIPILDGGHILFLIVEGIRHKPMSVRKLQIAQAFGLVLIITIFIFATYKDIIRFLLPIAK